MYPYSGLQHLYGTMGTGNTDFNISSSPVPIQPPTHQPPQNTVNSNLPHCYQYEMESSVQSAEPGPSGLGTPYMNGHPGSYNYSPPVSVGYFVQPHLAHLNMGTSGFPSPSVAVPNRTMPMPQNSNYSRIPFLGTASSTVYQFPSPIYSQPVLQQPLTTVMSSVQCSQRPLTSSEVKNGTATRSSWNPSMWNQPTAGMFTIGMSKKGPGGKSLKSESRARCKFHSKRRSWLAEDETEQPPQKVFINEVRMSERLQELNLDNNNLTWHPDLEEQPWFDQEPPPLTHNNNNSTTPDSGIQMSNNEEDSDDDISDLEDCAHVDPKDKDLPRLNMLEDLRHVNAKDILPKSILQEIAKPTMQIVLWKAPGDFVKEILPPEPEPDQPVLETSSSLYSPDGSIVQSDLEAADGMDAVTECTDTLGLPQCPDDVQSGLCLPRLPSMKIDVIQSPSARGENMLFDSVDDDMDL